MGGGGSKIEENIEKVIEKVKVNYYYQKIKKIY
jgi:hypothetical protein